MSILLTTCYYLYTRKAIPFDYFSQKYNVRIIVGLLFTCVICFGITVFHQRYDIVLLKVFVIQFEMLCALMYALPLLIPKEDENKAFERASLIICYAFTLQGAIQLSGFFIPAWGDFLISMKPQEMQDVLLEGGITHPFRGYSLSGSPFFELPAGFGIAFILLFRLVATEGQQYLSRKMVYTMIFFFFIGSLFSGRTAFIGIIMAFIMGLFFMKKEFSSLLKTFYQSIILLLLFFVSYFFLPQFIQDRMQNEVFPFAFEGFYNYSELGEFRTLSTDVMIEKHYYMLSEKTFILGDGQYINDSGANYYGETDAGYMRSILYGGVFFSLLLIVYQLLYFFQPFVISYVDINNKESWRDFICLLFLFLHLFILEYKGETIGRQNITMAILLFVCTAYITRYYHQLKSSNYELTTRNLKKVTNVV